MRWRFRAVFRLEFGMVSSLLSLRLRCADCPIMADPKAVYKGYGRGPAIVY
jgi:hypothetical protein